MMIMMAKMQFGLFDSFVSLPFEFRYVKMVLIEIIPMNSNLFSKSDTH